MIMHNGRTCPNDEMLMDYLEQRLPDDRRSQMENHLAECAGCREQVAVCADLLNREVAGDTPPVPAHVTRKAVDAVRGLTEEAWHRKWANGLHEWVGRGMNRGSAVLDRLSWGRDATPAMVRGKTDALVPPLIRREKEFDNLKVVIEIEKGEAGQATIRVSGESSTENISRVRVALVREEREVASSLLGTGTVCFDSIPIGTYCLVFVERNKITGEYVFEITDHPQSMNNTH